MAPRHIGQGSHEVKISHPLRSKVPRRRVASLMALTSAWAVGSQSSVTLLAASATISPPRAITAPKGPPPLRTLSSARVSALLISSSFVIVFCFCSHLQRCSFFVTTPNITLFFSPRSICRSGVRRRCAATLAQRPTKLQWQHR